MLVLTRKKGEAVLVGNEIRIEIIRTTPSGRVTLGLKVPNDYKVLREELQPEDVGAKLNQIRS